MVVDDRRILANLTKPTIGIWNQFTMVGNAPSSTAYVMLNGKRKSLRSAISQGWISSEGIRFESGGKFYYYKDVDQNFFEDGKRYQVKPLLSGVTIHIPIPQNKFQSDRARLDIIRAVKDDSRFQSVSTLSYEHDPKWHADWEMHTMSFAHRANYLMPIKQITNKKNPLLRYISINDPGTGKWSLWRKVDWNQLY